MRRLAIALGLLAPAACGLAFSPGDYREPGETASPSSVDGSTTNNEGGSITDLEGGTDGGLARTRIALFAGRRDALAGEANGINVAETMLTSIDAEGNLGPIAFDTPPPAAAQWSHAALLDGKVYIHTSSALALAPLSDQLGAWTLLSIPAPPPGQTGLKPWALDSHGLFAGRSGAPAIPLSTSAWIAPLAAGDAGVSAWSMLTAQTAVPRTNTRLVRGGDNVYIVGGETPTVITNPIGPLIPNHSEVEVAKLGPNGDLGSFHATTALPAVADAGAAFATFDPIGVANADHLYLLGGLTTSNASSLTDVAVATKIKDTGDLDVWTVLPKLPQRMNAFAAVITPSWLVVFGGQVPASTGSSVLATDSVLRLAIHADGTFGTSWETAGHLPGARASVVGVTY